MDWITLIISFIILLIIIIATWLLFQSRHRELEFEKNARRKLLESTPSYEGVIIDIKYSVSAHGDITQIVLDTNETFIFEDIKTDVLIRSYYKFWIYNNELVKIEKREESRSGE